MNPQSGGPCQGIRNSAMAMEQYDVENEVVCLDPPDSEFISKDNFKIFALGPAKSPWSYSAKLFPWLLENFGKYDAVIVHGLWLYSSHAVEKVMRNIKSPPWFVMPHGMLDPYFQKSRDRRLKALRNRIYWKLFENKVVNRANGVLFTTQEELLLARQSFDGYSPKKELNVGYGIQTPPAFQSVMKDAFYTSEPLAKEKPFLLFLGRIDPKKGVDLLIHAFSEINPEELLLVIAGPGRDSEYGQQLINLVSKKGMSEKILFPGMLQGKAKWGAFYLAQAFALPSHQENFGIAVAEALACGTPVLISDRVNIWREIQASASGFVQPDTLEGTVSLVKEWLYTSSGAKAEMKKNASSAFRDKFDINSNVKELIEVIVEEIDQ